MKRVCLSLALLVSAVACGSDPDDASAATSAQEPIAASGRSTTSATGAPAETAPSSRPMSSGTAAPAQTSSSTTTAPPPRCEPLADLEDADELGRWQVVNDGVMGGRSSAEATVVDGELSLAGEIVTDGGGFSSVRLALAEPLGEATGLLLRLRTDGRAYELTLADAAPGRDRRVSHQAPIAATGGTGWEEVVVDFADLDASFFGRPVDADPFDPTAAVEVGIILADGSDGPFRLELDWIRVCP